MRGWAATLLVLVAGCGAADQEAPAYGDPGPACPRLEERLDGLLSAVDRGETAALSASLDAALDPHTVGRLVEVARAVVRALPKELSAPEVELPGGLLAAAVRGLAGSPDLQPLGQRIGPVLATCNLAPMIRVGAAVLRDPSLPAFIEAVGQSSQDADAIATLRATLFETPGQRTGWPHVAVPLICSLRNTDDDLAAFRQFLVPLLGERAEEPPLSTAVDGLISLLAPGTDARRHAAEWVGCYVGRPPGPDAFACPYPLPALSPDPDAVLIRVLWDVVSAATAEPPPGAPPAPWDPSLLPGLAEIFDRLADETHIGQAWADVLAALLAAPGAPQALEEVAELLDRGAADELLRALGAAGQGCGP